ncbi:hypothetical protein MJO29_004578, partial [Puccinia striiformis f. sp. tritici]
SRIFDKK